MLNIGAMAIAPYGCFNSIEFDGVRDVNFKGVEFDTFKNEAKKWRSPVGRVALIPTYGFYFISMLLKLGNALYKIQKHYNLSYFSQKLFFNVKIPQKI